MLGQSLFPLFALALDLPEDFFDDKVILPPCRLEVIGGFADRSDKIPRSDHAITLLPSSYAGTGGRTGTGNRSKSTTIESLIV